MSRYTVNVVHQDGNAVEVSRHADLADAQRRANQVREFTVVTTHGLPVLVWDDTDLERGDLSDADSEE